jgi:hypothetical protein
MSTFSKPIDELVAIDISQTVAEITRDNDYHIDVSSIEMVGQIDAIERQNRLGAKPIDQKAILIQGEEEPIALENCALGHEEWWQPFEIWYFAINPDNSSNPIDLRLNLAKADITSALITDAPRNPPAPATAGLPSWARGGFAQQTIARAPGYIYQDDQLVGIAINVAVHIRTLYADRFSL